MKNFRLKRINNYPTLEQEEFLQLGLNRYIYLSTQLLENSNQSEQQKFIYLKDLISVYSEMEAYPPLKTLTDNAPDGNPILQFRPLFKAIRNLLAHFPFFSTWDEFWFNKNLVVCMNPTGSTIDKYFSNQDEHPQFFFRFKNKETDHELVGKIRSSSGYDTNNKIKLVDILSLDDAIALIVGYSHMVLSTVIDGNDLQIFDVS